MGKVTAESESISSTCRVMTPPSRRGRGSKKVSAMRSNPDTELASARYIGVQEALAQECPLDARVAEPRHLRWSAAAESSWGSAGRDTHRPMGVRGKDENPAQRPLTARPAHGDVDSGQAQHHRLGRFRLTRFGFGAERAAFGTGRAFEPVPRLASTP